jgi:hypothetical protein
MINNDVSPTNYFSANTTTERIFSDFGEELFYAGRAVEPGCYVDIEANRQIVLEQTGVLPASLDGRRAIYRKMERPWIVLIKTEITTAHN